MGLWQCVQFNSSHFNKCTVDKKHWVGLYPSFPSLCFHYSLLIKLCLHLAVTVAAMWSAKKE
jgi:hypothetical protein